MTRFCPNHLAPLGPKHVRDCTDPLQISIEVSFSPIAPSPAPQHLVMVAVANLPFLAMSLRSIDELLV
jgi:hypothetical protein